MDSATFNYYWFWGVDRGWYLSVPVRCMIAEKPMKIRFEDRGTAKSPRHSYETLLLVTTVLKICHLASKKLTKVIRHCQGMSRPRLWTNLLPITTKEPSRSDSLTPLDGFLFSSIYFNCLVYWNSWNLKIGMLKFHSATGHVLKAFVFLMQELWSSEEKRFFLAMSVLSRRLWPTVHKRKVSSLTLCQF